MSLAGLADAGERIRASTVRVQGAKLYRYFPDCLPTCKADSLDKRDHQLLDGTQLYCRALYPVHIGFFEDGLEHRERVLIAANRIGKTDADCCEVCYHTTGVYPDWWTGKRFEEPVQVWIAGDTGKTVRDIVQMKLLGQRGSFGSGFIPAHLLMHTTAKAGIPDAIEGIYVEHVSGGTSTIQLKSYDQRREAFQGTAMNIIWLDEEPPLDIYVECLLRTAKTSDFVGGIMLMTFTPLQGLTKLVQNYQKAVKEQREAADEESKRAQSGGLGQADGAEPASRDSDAGSVRGQQVSTNNPNPKEKTDGRSRSSNRPATARVGSTRTARQKPKSTTGDAGALLQSLAASKKRKPNSRKKRKQPRRTTRR